MSSHICKHGRDIRPDRGPGVVKGRIHWSDMRTLKTSCWQKFRKTEYKSLAVLASPTFMRILGFNIFENTITTSARPLWAILIQAVLLLSARFQALLSFTASVIPPVDERNRVPPLFSGSDWIPCGRAIVKPRSRQTTRQGSYNSCTIYSRAHTKVGRGTTGIHGHGYSAWTVSLADPHNYPITVGTRYGMGHFPSQCKVGEPGLASKWVKNFLYLCV